MLAVVLIFLGMAASYVLITINIGRISLVVALLNKSIVVLIVGVIYVVANRVLVLLYLFMIDIASFVAKGRAAVHLATIKVGTGGWLLMERD